MLRVGLTGNIGSGKSLVCRIFESTGIPVFKADEAGHAALEDQKIKDNLLTRYGSVIIQADGSLDRRKLSGIVFSKTQELEYLSSLVHPFVEKCFNAWCDRQKDAQIVIQEAAIIFESGFNKYFDRIILVSAPEEIRLQRVLQRDAITISEARARMDRQWPEEKKIPLSDYVINNDGKLPIIPQVIKILEALKGIK
ncbi:MAG: dephospho-CoA kinase [Bacteroidales bacterium]|jgi:dephospho-CoA kinase|nr:dephospho-CoA kinase [Bacteroidales bacterium]MDN5328633.1 dephospho-CoA kinase [Bacteroidales bacterium]